MVAMSPWASWIPAPKLSPGGGPHDGRPRRRGTGRAPPIAPGCGVRFPLLAGRDRRRARRARRAHTSTVELQSPELRDRRVAGGRLTGGTCVAFSENDRLRDGKILQEERPLCMDGMKLTGAGGSGPSRSEMPPPTISPKCSIPSRANTTSNNSGCQELLR
jgi:hypothetical protein